MKFILIPLVIVLSVLGCSKAPEQFNTDRAKAPPVDLNKAAPTLTDVENPKVVNVNGVHKPAT
jgi:hypothetical protein